MPPLMPLVSLYIQIRRSGPKLTIGKQPQRRPSWIRKLNLINKTDNLHGSFATTDKKKR